MADDDPRCARCRELEDELAEMRRQARLVRPRLREWEARWWRAVAENDRLRSRIGTLLREVSRLNDAG